jgi:tetratricopeptide (TPR) repeat protein
LTKLLDPANPNLDDLTWIGRYYYMGDNLKAADSVFTAITQKNPDYLPAYLWSSNTSVKMDPDYKKGLAKPKFEKLLQVAKSDSVKNASTMIDAMGYLSYYHMINDNLGKSREYYTRMINLSDNKDYKIRGYNGLGNLELRTLSGEKTNEGRLPILARASESFNKILSIDPANTSAKSQLSWIRDYEAQIKKGINPNEIKGVVKNAAGAPIAYASIRVKDTAAENLTNGKGEYKFEIPQGSETLIVSAKGYKSVELPITKSRVYNVTLEQ